MFLKSPMLIMILTVVILLCAGPGRAESIWELQQIDASGTGVHPAIVSITQTVSISGVVLNNSTDYLPLTAPWGAPIWQVYVQSLEGNQSGIALFEGYFAGNQAETLHTLGIRAGDIVSATGFIANHNGKVNMNTRHGGVDLFEVEVIGHQSELPTPILIPQLASCAVFDSSDTEPGPEQYRRQGAELYQNQWCRISKVSIMAGTWGNGETITVTDESGATLDVLLSQMGDFDGQSPPPEPLDLVGVFDQEDANTDGDFHDGYRLWVKKMTDVTSSTQPSGVDYWDLY